MELIEAKRILEALLFISGVPVSVKRIKEVLPEIELTTVRQLLAELHEDYVKTQRVFRIQEVAGSYQLVTDPELAPAMKQRLQMPRPDWLSKAAMETIAIITYRQPLTKAEIEVIRGVDVTGTLETLIERQFVRVVGRKETPGRPLLYGTTTEFLRHFGIKSIEHLPPLGAGAMPSLPGLADPGASPAESSLPEPQLASAVLETSEPTVPQRETDDPAIVPQTFTPHAGLRGRLGISSATGGRDAARGVGEGATGVARGAPP